MKYESQGLERYANTDPSLHYNTIEPQGPDWRDEYLAKLMDHDYEGAHELRLRNDARYARETDPQVTVVKTGHTPLQSCAHVQIERDEQEAA